MSAIGRTAAHSAFHRSKSYGEKPDSHVRPAAYRNDESFQPRINVPIGQNAYKHAMVARPMASGQRHRSIRPRSASHAVFGARGSGAFAAAPPGPAKTLIGCTSTRDPFRNGRLDRMRS